MTSKIQISSIQHDKEIDVLFGQKSVFRKLEIEYGKKDIDHLKKNLTHAKSLYLIAKTGNEFAGFLAVDDEWWEPNYFFIREIFVTPKHQRQKIGEKFIELSIEHAKKFDAKGIVTETDFRNQPFQNLLAKFGFRKFKNPQWDEGLTLKLSF